MKTILELHREIEFKSAVLGLQIAYNNCRKAINDYLEYTGYGDNGEFYTRSGHDDRTNAVMKWANEVSKQKAIVDGYLAWKRGEQE